MNKSANMQIFRTFHKLIIRKKLPCSLARTMVRKLRHESDTVSRLLTKQPQFETVKVVFMDNLYSIFIFFKHCIESKVISVVFEICASKVTQMILWCFCTIRNKGKVFINYKIRWQFYTNFVCWKKKSLNHIIFLRPGIIGQLWLTSSYWKQYVQNLNAPQKDSIFIS